MGRRMHLGGKPSYNAKRRVRAVKNLIASREGKRICGHARLRPACHECRKDFPQAPMM